jgi:hypothetical protein
MVLMKCVQIMHRYLRKVYWSSFVMCPLLVLALAMAFLRWTFTVLTTQISQAVRAINWSIFYMMSMGLCQVC